MKKLTMTLAMVVGMSGLALANDPKAPAPTPTKAPAPEAKKAPEAAKPTDPKAAAPKAADPKAKAPEPMKPPAEIAALGKTLAGTWKCTGKMADMADMTKMVDIKGMTMAFKVDLKGWWISGALKSAAFNGQMYATYDTNKKMWYRLMVDTMGGSETSWSAGVKDGKIVWDGEMRGMGMPAMKARTTETMVSAKETSMVGEMSMDGKTWMKGWEATCKK